VKLAPTVHNNWHLDGEDYKSISGFSILWGSYINSLPEGEMGNLLVYPGTHHVMADIFRKKGAIFHYDGKVEKPKPKPELRKEGIAEGKGYSLCVESGDIIFAHPWLAHGIGQNNSDQTRLAVYCRLHSPGFWMPGGGRSKMAGTHVGFTKGMPDQPKLWTGDPWANVTNINPWIKANSEFLSNYDNG
jgi:ectoine hydroxylase-related dioxygenase (phytanoyl-CoA dioxygenase family)